MRHIRDQNTKMTKIRDQYWYLCFCKGPIQNQKSEKKKDPYKMRHIKGPKYKNDKNKGPVDADAILFQV